MLLQAIAYTIAVSALLSVVGLCADWFARLHRLPLRGVWAAALLMSVLLPAAMIGLARPTEIRNVAVPFAEPDSRATLELPAIDESPARVPAPALPSAAPMQTVPSPTAASGTARPLWKLPRNYERLFLAMWLAASSLLTLYLVGATLLLRRRMKGWRNTTVQDVEVMVSEVTGPALLGPFTPRIVVPRWVLQEPQGAQALILQHEQQHVLARDALLVMVGLVVIVAVPWNLPLYWQWRRLRQAIEMDCDARVLAAGAEAGAYAQVLLAITQRASGIPAGALAMSEPVHALERRIASLLPDAIPYPGLQTIAVLLVAAAGTGAALALEAPALPGRAAAAPIGASQADSAAESAATPTSSVTGFARGEYLVAAVTRGDVQDVVTFPGRLRPRDSADVVANVSGRINRLHVAAGDVVRQGDLLVELDATTAIDKVDGMRAQFHISEINLETQESHLEKAERDYRRLENLPAVDAATREASSTPRPRSGTPGNRSAWPGPGSRWTRRTSASRSRTWATPGSSLPLTERS